MRNPAKAPEFRDLVAREQLSVSILALDVDSDQSVEQAVKTILAQGSQIDVLVNNAGVERAGSIEELPMEAFRQTMETNYFGALRCIRAVLPGMREARNGCIINITSVAGRIAVSPLAPYAASKFALEALSEALAQEVKPFDIRVAVVEPGIIDTPMARRIEAPPSASLYRQGSRFAGMFEASLATPTPPTLVAAKIREIIESGTWKLRHPAGPDAEPFLGWRASMNDEQWVEWGALEDQDWYERVSNDFGLEVRRRPLQAGAAGTGNSPE
jgi:NAD(P)-dependent dehydrogenase (short-subunit alcohol dehydrogenase family)